MRLHTYILHSVLTAMVTPVAWCARPHVVFVLVDDWGSADAAFREAELRPADKPVLQTPTLDRLRSDGVELKRYYVQHICSPTRTALLSGRYQIHTGLQDGIIQAWAKVCLPPRFGTIADAFSALGYATHGVGKWHAGIFQDACLPWRRGFDTYYGFLTGSEHHYTKMQRIARGDGSGNGTTRDFPDLRTHEGPVVSHCIRPPFAPPPPPPTPCGRPSLPKCNYTNATGYLPAGHDVVPPAMMTIAEAIDACNAAASCEAITFESDTNAATCTTTRCKIFLKSSASGLTGGDPWRSMFKHPQPHTSQGDPSCYSTLLFTTRATKLIVAHDASQPFFLYLALQDVHEPIEVPSAYSAPFASAIHDGVRRTYAGMVSVVDECVANLTASLRRKAMWNNSILVLSNDNGGWVGYGGLNTPYRGHKTTLWEGGIRGLGVVVAPGRLPRGASYPNLFHVTDWLPTLVSAAGGDLSQLGPKFTTIDGTSQWAELVQSSALTISPNATAPRSEILHNIEGVNGAGVAVLRVGKYKLLHQMQTARGFDGWCDACNHTDGCWVPPHSGPGVGDEGKTVPLGGQLCCLAAPPWRHNYSASCDVYNGTQPLPVNLLYNIDDDPSEQHDIASSEPALLNALLTRLAEYNETNVPCCICTGSSRTSEMDVPPRDGYWYSFIDQTPNHDPNCQLQGA